MKNLYIILFTFFIFTYLNAQIADIPDANFKNTLVIENIVNIDEDDIGDVPVDINNECHSFFGMTFIFISS